MKIEHCLPAFVGSVLLLMVQPLAGKTMLPAFGGTFSVWAVALLFFQTGLLVGYALVHALVGEVATRRRWGAAAGLVALGGTVAWLAPADAVPLPLDPSAPIGAQLSWMLRAIGLPFAVLSMNGPLLIRLANRSPSVVPGVAATEVAASGGHVPPASHRLFAVTNLGSLIGALGFPLLLEPFWDQDGLWAIWRWGVPVWSCLVGLAIATAWRDHLSAEAPAPPPPLATRVDSESTAGGVAAVDPSAMRARQEVEVLLRAAGAAPTPAADWIGSPSPGAENPIDRTAVPDPTAARPPLAAWWVPAAAGTALLTATTNVITQDVSAMPILWVMPLAVYLATWIAAFAEDEPRMSPLFRHQAALVALGLGVGMAEMTDVVVDPLLKGPAMLVLLWAGCTVGHTVLAWRRPGDPAAATRFYFAVGAGGVIGTALAGLFAPAVCRGLGEYALAWGLLAVAIWPARWRAAWSADPMLFVRFIGIGVLVWLVPALARLGLPATAPFLFSAMIGAVCYMGWVLWAADERPASRPLLAAAMTLAVLALDLGTGVGAVRAATRTFYGRYRVLDADGIRTLQMGSTHHGHEVLVGPAAGQPIAYYHPDAAIGRLMDRLAGPPRSDAARVRVASGTSVGEIGHAPMAPGGESETSGSHPAAGPTPLRLAVVGLGAGVLAHWGRPGMKLDFYELDPAAEILARTWFSYLGSSAAQITVLHGDGRSRIRSVPGGAYDLLFLDAFNSDAVPAHLLTREAMAEFRRGLADDGVLLYHVSNRLLNLAPLVLAAARDLGLAAMVGQNPMARDRQLAATRWVAVGSPAGLAHYVQNTLLWASATVDATTAAWTDRRCSLWAAWPPDLSYVAPTGPASSPRGFRFLAGGSR